MCRRVGNRKSYTLIFIVNNVSRTGHCCFTGPWIMEVYFIWTRYQSLASYKWTMPEAKSRCMDINNAMDQTPPWEIKSRSGSQGFSRLIWNQMVHFLVHKDHTVNLILKHMSLSLHPPYYFFKIHFNIVVPPKTSSSKNFLPQFRINFTSLSCVLCVPTILFSFIWWP